MVAVFVASVVAAVKSPKTLKSQTLNPKFPPGLLRPYPPFTRVPGPRTIPGSETHLCWTDPCPKIGILKNAKKHPPWLPPAPSLGPLAPRALEPRAQAAPFSEPAVRSPVPFRAPRPCRTSLVPCFLLLAHLHGVFNGGN